jgi:SAM-dependent methyltransferase
MSQYTSAAGWSLIERVQKFAIHQQASEIARHIESKAKSKKISILDVGCGRGYFAGEVLKNLHPNREWDYIGLDRDQDAIHVANARFNGNSGLRGSIKTIISDAQNLEKNFNIDFEEEERISLFLSNTLFSIGTKDEIKILLQRMAKHSQSMLVSVVPWDRHRVQWHENYENWIKLSDEKGEFSFRSKTLVEDDWISQKIEFKDSDGEIHSVMHRFLRLEPEMIENLLRQSGWEINRVVNPMNFEKEGTEQVIPELFYLCSRSKEMK